MPVDWHVMQPLTPDCLQLLIPLMIMLIKVFNRNCNTDGVQGSLIVQQHI